MEHQSIDWSAQSIGELHNIAIDCHPIYEFIECAAQVQIHTYG